MKRIVSFIKKELVEDYKFFYQVPDALIVILTSLLFRNKLNLILSASSFFNDFKGSGLFLLSLSVGMFFHKLLPRIELLYLD